MALWKDLSPDPISIAEGGPVPEFLDPDPRESVQRVRSLDRGDVSHASIVMNLEEVGIPTFREGVMLAEGISACLIGGYANTSMESRSR